MQEHSNLKYPISQSNYFYIESELVNDQILRRWQSSLQSLNFLMQHLSVKRLVFSQRDQAEIWYPLATETATESCLYVLVSNSVICFLFSNAKKIGRRTNSWPFKNERMMDGHSSSIEFQDVVL